MKTVSNYLQSAEDRLQQIASLFALIGGVALVILATTTIVSVFWRYILRSPIFGVEDIATMALSVVVASAVAYGAQRHSHVSVNVITMIAKRPLTRFTDALARLLNVLTLLGAAYALFKKGSCGIACGSMTSNLAIPHEFFYYALVAAMGFYALVSAVHFFTGLAFWSGADPNERSD